MDIPDDFVRAAASFGGGIGLTKNTCGCISAGAMAVGLKYGTLEPPGTAPRPAYARTKAVLDRFRARFGTIDCRDLTAQWPDFADRERVYRCSELVDFTVEQLRDVFAAERQLPEWEEDWWTNYLTRRDKIK